jgi:hypothetical protein
MRRTSLCAGVVLLAALMSPAEAAPYKQAPPRTPAQPGRPAPPAPTAAPAAPDRQDLAAPGDERGANDTRDRLRRLLDQYPPTLHYVLRLDPSLLSRPDYLAPYPALDAFLRQHPEVARNPSFFIGDENIVKGNQGPSDPQVEAVRAWRGFADMIPVVAIVFIITSALAGLIRTLIEQRRWQRAARMEMELQNKLIDRFSGTNELLAYMQSPAGAGLAQLHSPSPVPGASPRVMDAPLGRIFWSLQAGIVLAAAGIGLLFVGERVTFQELGQPLSGMGILALTVGVGFVVSAGVSYLISHRLGLVTSATPPNLHREAPGA